MNLFKKNLQKNVVNRRDFKYTKGECNLTFTLRIDIKQELKDFKECLFEAEKDINKLLNDK